MAPMLIRRTPPASLSLVIPMYNEEAMVELLRQRLASVLSALGCAVEIVIVDDGSRDGTLAAVRRWALEDKSVTVLALSKNFGHQAACTAGLDHASGEAVVLMDADLQDPPELIAQLIREYERGYDVVYAQRERRVGESRAKRFTAWMFYRLFRCLARQDLPLDTGEYRLISADCLRALRRMRETHRFLRGMVAWVGYPQTAIRFVRPPRAAGQTKFPPSAMIRFAWTAILSFSPTPLRVAFAFSLFAALIGLAVIGYTLLAIAVKRPLVPGWPSLMLTICFIGICILMSVGLVGEYVAKIYEQAKRRPLYLINERLSVRPAGFRAAPEPHA